MSISFIDMADYKPDLKLTGNKNGNGKLSSLGSCLLLGNLGTRL